MYALLRRWLDPETLRLVATWFSRSVVVVAKIVVAYLRGILPGRSPSSWARVLVAAVCTTIVAGAVALGRLSLAFGWGSTDDPLGYVVHVKK